MQVDHYQVHPFLSERSKMKTLLIAAATVLLIQSAGAAVQIRGAPSCGAWVTDRAGNSWEERLDQSWLIGFLSGVATALNKNILRRTDNASLWLWMDNYCKANPLKDIDDGGSDLVEELRKMKGL